MAVDLGAVSPSAALCRRRAICSRRRVDGRMELESRSFIRNPSKMAKSRTSRLSLLSSTLNGEVSSDGCAAMFEQTLPRC